METQDPFESARIRYRPRRIKILFVAEAPPAVDSERFFYFVPVARGDTLFLEMMKVLYPDDFASAPEIRRRKEEFLERFKSDGFYLIDACRQPLPKGARRSEKERIIREDLPILKAKLKDLRQRPKIILIGRPVYNICSAALNNFGVINREMIDFPARGRQPQFRQKLSALLKN